MPPIKSLYQGMFKLYRWPLLILVGLFSLGIILGVVLPPNLKLMVLAAVLEKFTSIVGDANTAWELTQRIFINNFWVSLLLYGLGFTILLPVIMMVVNGVVIGLFLNLMYRLDTLMPGMFWSSIVSLLPHGVFELTAFFFSGALSVMVLVKAIFTTVIEPLKLRRQVLLESILRFFTLVVPLLIVAALMEGFVSPRLGSTVGAWLYSRHQTTALAITPATTFLSQHNCTVLPITDTKQSLGTSQMSDITTLAKALYDPATYQLLKQRAAVPRWEQYYTCDNNLIVGIKSYPTDQWPVEQAATLQSLFDHRTTSAPYTTAIQQLDNKTVIVAMSADITANEVLQQ